MSATFEQTLYTQLLAEQTRLRKRVENLTSGNASESDIIHASNTLANVTLLLDNWTAYVKLRSDANVSLQTAYEHTNSATATLNTLTTEANILAESLKADNQTKQKMVDINIYYSKQYEAYKELFMLITIVGICIVASLLLVYTPLEFLSRSLTIAICILGGTIIVYKIITMMLRTDYNYDEYNWTATPPTDNGLSSSDKLIDISGINLSKTICVGPLCCGEGTEWNSKQGCVLINPQEITSS